MPALALGSGLHHDSRDALASYPSLPAPSQQHSGKFVPPNFAAAVSAAAAQAALSSSHKSAFVPTSHQLSLYRSVSLYLKT
jgi:hypothetical protein